MALSQWLILYYDLPGKAQLPGDGQRPWTFECIEKELNATIDKLYPIYEQYAIQQKAEATGLALRGHVVKFHSMGIFRTEKSHQLQLIHKGSGS